MHKQPVLLIVALLALGHLATVSRGVAAAPTSSYAPSVADNLARLKAIQQGGLPAAARAGGPGDTGAANVRAAVQAPGGAARPVTVPATLAACLFSGLSGCCRPPERGATKQNTPTRPRVPPARPQDARRSARASSTSSAQPPAWPSQWSCTPTARAMCSLQPKPSWQQRRTGSRMRSAQGLPWEPRAWRVSSDRFAGASLLEGQSAAQGQPGLLPASHMWLPVVSPAPQRRRPVQQQPAPGDAWREEAGGSWPAAAALPQPPQGAGEAGPPR